MRLGCLCVCLCLAGSMLRADQVVLKNGDHLTGSLVKKDSKSLTIKGDTYGTVSVPWDQVQSLATEKPVHVELSGGQMVRATIGAREDRIVLQSPPAAERLISLGDILFLRDDAEQAAYQRLLSPGWAQVWAGTAAFGLAGTQGNAETRTLTLSLNAARVTNSDKTVAYFNAIRASALIGGIDASTAQAVRGGWAYSRNIHTRTFVNVFNDYEYDRFQTLDLRFVLGGGLGYMLWKTERARLDLLGGAAYNREKFSPPAPRTEFTRNSGEAYFGDDLSYKLNSVTSLYQNLRFFPNLTNTGEYRMNFDLGANTRLVRWLTWTIAISDRYLSNPVPGRKKNDFLYTTGIGVSFSR